MTKAIYRTPAWRSLRRQTLERAGHVCQIQMPGCTVQATAADHIVELDDGGEPYALENLQAACKSCNTAKRNRAVARRAKRAGLAVRSW